MAQPTVTVEVSLAAPGDTPAWTDISSAFRRATINRGKATEDDEARPGTCTLVLSNADRTFDPLHGTGSLSPDWKVVRRLRIVAHHGGNDYPQFTGLIDSIRQVYSPPNEAIAEVQCIDSMLAAQGLPSSAYAAELQAADPAVWWRLGDPEDSGQAIDRISGGLPLTPAGAPEFGAESLAINEPDAAITFPDWPDGLQGVFPAGTWPLSGSDGWSVSYMYRYDEEVIGEGAFHVGLVTLPAGPGFPTSGIDVVVQTIIGYLTATVRNSAGDTYEAITTGVNLIDGATHHVVVTWEHNDEVRIYVDGDDATDYGFPAVFTGNMTNTTSQWLAAVNAVDYAPYILGGQAATYDEYAAWNRVLTTLEIESLHQAAITAWRGDTTGERFDRILDVAGWPAGDRDIDDGQTVLQSAELDITALDHLNEVTLAEQGLWFVTKDGVVRFRERHAGLNLASSGTFGDGPGELPYTDLVYSQSASTVVNVVRYQREGGVIQEVRDVASIAGYYERTYELTGLIVGGSDPDGEMFDAATARLTKYGQPISRIESFVVNPQSDETNLFPQVLGRELGDEIRVIRRPQGVGSDIDAEYRIEGIQLTIDRYRWQAVWMLSPGDAGVFLQLDLTSGPGLGQLQLAY